MLTTARFVNPDDLEVEMTVRMPLRRWRELRGQLTTSAWYPASDLDRAIADVIRQAEERFIAAPTGETT